MRARESMTPDRERESCAVALVLIDVINPMAFEGSEALVRQAVPMSKRLSGLKERARAARVPTIYVNDNFGRWRSDFRSIVAHCLDDDVPGKPVAAKLEPDSDDYFVLKPLHSGFHATALHLLLEHLGAKRLVLTGIAGNICVLFTANDAYMRGFEILVPSDCLVSNTEEENRWALSQMESILKADIRQSTEIDFQRLRN